MQKNIWFAVTVLFVVCFASFALDWFAQPEVVQAASGMVEVGAVSVQPVQSVQSASPVVQIAIAVVVGLFGFLSLMTVLKDDGRG